MRVSDRFAGQTAFHYEKPLRIYFLQPQLVETEQDNARF